MKGKVAITLTVAAIIAACFELSLLLTGHRVLVGETRVQPGVSYVLPEYGDVGKNAQASLVCRYFTGRGVATSVLWYSSNNVMGRDECPFLSTQVSDAAPSKVDEGSEAEWFAGWASLAAVIVALLGYWLVELQRRKDETKRRQDAAYQIGFKVASLASDVRNNDGCLFPEGAGIDDWKNVQDPFQIVGAQQPAVGYTGTVSRDLTEAEQNLLMLLREENFLMAYSEIYARNLSIMAGMQEYKERYAAVMAKLPAPVAATGQVATMGITQQQKLELHPYITPAATLIQSLRGLSVINVEMITTLSDTFQPMMRRHFPRLHIHKIELLEQPAS